MTRCNPPDQNVWLPELYNDYSSLQLLRLDIANNKPFTALPVNKGLIPYGFVGLFSGSVGNIWRDYQITMKRGALKFGKSSGVPR